MDLKRPKISLSIKRLKCVPITKNKPVGGFKIAHERRGSNDIVRKIKKYYL